MPLDSCKYSIYTVYTLRVYRFKVLYLEIKLKVS